MSENVIFGINGPVVTIKGETDLSMMEMVYVGKEKLIGEVIGLDKKMTTIQVYEETTGLKPGEPVYSTGLPMSVTLGPGIIGNIFAVLYPEIDIFQCTCYNFSGIVIFLYIF